MRLKLKNVSLQLGGLSIIKDISLSVDQGEVVGLLGPNGAGKTSSFNLLIGLLRPDFGNVLLDSQPIQEYSMPRRARMGIGYLPQEPSVFRHLTVSQNLELALNQSFLSRPLSRLRKEELIEDFNLGRFINRYGYQLSGGERRRCEIARALAVGSKGPQFLLLDEPFAGVDPMAVADLQNLIHRLRNKGMGILITDHNVRETLAITDNSYILSEGKILASGLSSEVASDSLVRRNYLGEGFQL
ncbi:LPS export ABC transporter ATP-binding protein [Prochlorococcus sp. MIT 1223]|uniref:LPS export ABC transporter ATP-binding protein n=1 Tax=Prochlorococcus sp. MIT 1223 TaxID=3096217 RepID=UPI002A758C2D|nr:LPS export ABC transporter ATP-binding protein [Prochlorococcus sp. MIT 1223]